MAHDGFLWCWMVLACSRRLLFVHAQTVNCSFKKWLDLDDAGLFMSVFIGFGSFRIVLAAF